MEPPGKPGGFTYRTAINNNIDVLLDLVSAQYAFENSIQPSLRSLLGQNSEFLSNVDGGDLGTLVDLYSLAAVVAAYLADLEKCMNVEHPSPASVQQACSALSASPTVERNRPADYIYARAPRRAIIA